jgi:hypothetical protein
LQGRQVYPFFQTLIDQGATPKLKPRERLVWLLGRPLQGMGSLLAPGGFPYLHWAVLVSLPDYGVEKMNSLFDALQNWPRDVTHFTMGIVLELRFDQVRASTDQRGRPISTLDFIHEFPSSSVACAGLTTKSDPEIFELGISATITDIAEPS